MNNRGWFSKLADAWTKLYEGGGKEHLEEFVSMYWIFWSEVAEFVFDRTNKGKVADETKIGKIGIIGNMKITERIVNQTKLSFTPFHLHDYKTYKAKRGKITSLNPSRQKLFSRNLSNAKVEIIKNEVMGFLTDPSSLSATTPNDESSLIVEIKKALTFRLANLLKMAGLTEWPSQKDKVVFEGNEGKFFSPYTHTTS